METKTFIGEAAGEIFMCPDVHSVSIEGEKWGRTEEWSQVKIHVRFGTMLAHTWYFKVTEIEQWADASDVLNAIKKHIASGVAGPLEI